MKKNLSSLMALCLISILSVVAQNTPRFTPVFKLGVNAIVEGGSLNKDVNPKPATPKVDFSPGVSFEAQLSKHSGIETGLYYRQLTFPANKDYNGWKENHIYIPIYYKFYSRILNFATGVNIGFNLNHPKERTWGSGSMDYSAILRISKDFKLCNKLSIEPLVQGGIGTTSWLGIGVGLKYSFTK